MHKSARDKVIDSLIFGDAMVSSVITDSKDMLCKKRKQESLACEFLVMCDIGLGIITTELPIASSRWHTVRRSFIRFNADHLDLLQLRQKKYLNAADGGRECAGRVLAIAMADFTGNPENIVPWASAKFDKITALFLDFVKRGTGCRKRTTL
jgi:hypothetical protein